MVEEILGVHYIADLWNCNKLSLNDSNFISSSLKEAVGVANATLLEEIKYEDIANKFDIDKYNKIIEYFGDYCQFIDYPEGVNLDNLNNERLSEEPKLIETKHIVEKVKFLEENPQIKESFRQKGIEYIQNNFDINIIGHKWVNFLSNF